MVIDIYVAMADGVWTYESKAHGLLPYLLRDIRTDTGVQDFVGTAPLNLVYVAHGERMTDISPGSVGSSPRSIWASWAKTFICSAPRKALQRSSGERSNIRSLPAH